MNEVKKWKTQPNLLPEPTAATLRRIWAKIEVTDGCWNWTGALNDCGYAASVPVDGSKVKHKKTYLPHRLMFSWFKWAIPEDLTIDHLCNNRGCMNPDHMATATIGDNVRRAVKRPYCKNGHPQTPENRYKYKNKERCKPCITLNNQKYRESHRPNGNRKCPQCVNDAPYPCPKCGSCKACCGCWTPCE